jgi:hypothetical protein
LADGRHEAGEDRYPECLTIMSDDDKNRPLIRNEDTLHRRAWIDRALAGVRGTLKPAELGEGAGAAPPAGPAEPAAKPGPAPAPDATRPRLYLVRNPRGR